MYFHRLSTLCAAGAFSLSCVATARLVGAQGTVESAANRAATLLVRPGDRIDMRFYREPQLTGSFTVNEEGEAAFPKLGVIRVTEFTIAQLQDTLRGRYSEYMRMPELEVSVLRRIIVTGEVRAPNVYLLDVTSSVRDAIAKAGGLTESGSKDRVSIVRDGTRLSANGWEADQGPAMDLKSGDQVLVGRKPWIVLNFLPAVSTAVVVVSLIISLRR